MSTWYENIFNKDKLSFNLTFASLYIAIYENMTDYVVSKLKEMMSEVSVENGVIIFTESKEYKDKIRNRVVDNKGNKNVLKASFLWLVEKHILTQEDYNKFLEVKKLRNKYAHELFNVMIEGISESDFQRLTDIIYLYKKFSNWSFINYEAAIIGYDLSDNVDEENIQAAPNYIFEVILDILYSNETKDYTELIEALKNLQ